MAEFTKGAKCFVDQYGSITDKTAGQNLNGENTQGENIADNGGVKLTFKVFMVNSGLMHCAAFQHTMYAFI